MLISMGFGLVC